MQITLLSQSGDDYQGSPGELKVLSLCWNPDDVGTDTSHQLELHEFDSEREGKLTKSKYVLSTDLFMESASRRYGPN